jgi:hypothetical protein
MAWLSVLWRLRTKRDRRLRSEVANAIKGGLQRALTSVSAAPTLKPETSQYQPVQAKSKAIGNGFSDFNAVLIQNCPVKYSITVRFDEDARNLHTLISQDLDLLVKQDSSTRSAEFAVSRSRRRCRKALVKWTCPSLGTTSHSNHWPSMVKMRGPINVHRNFQHFINSIPGQTPQNIQENLLHPGLHGGLFGVTVIGHFGRHVDFAFLFTRRARAAACSQRSGLFSELSPQRIKGFPISIVKRTGEHDRRERSGQMKI